MPPMKIFGWFGIFLQISRKFRMWRQFLPGGSGRTVYLSKVPRVEKKIRAAFDWTWS
jgi:hypothetical protein